MPKRSYGDPDCAVARSLEQMGDGWTLLVLREAFFGTRRFADFSSRLSIAKNVLSNRLGSMVEHGLLEKVQAGRFGDRFEYQLTRKGKDLATVLAALRQWGDRWIFEGQAPLEVVDTATGEPILPIRIRRSDGTPVPAREMRFQPGPGASPEAWAARRLPNDEDPNDEDPE